ncbi:MAG: 2-isopropylmalate synthase, partial [Firmicutes bacterium]|nr:2-isopropylmalate synthase [Bacillota bacterium]
EKIEAVALGAGPLDAAYNAVDSIINPPEYTFDDFKIDSVSDGTDALGDVFLKIATGGAQFTGRGLSTDIIEASIDAYLNAMNKVFAAEKKAKEA